MLQSALTAPMSSSAHKAQHYNALRWKTTRWKGSSGLVTNTSLWDGLLHEISEPGREVLWVKVPSHIDVPGNEEADRLSNMGRMSHPKYPAKATTAFKVIYTTPTPKVKRQKSVMHARPTNTRPRRLIA